MNRVIKQAYTNKMMSFVSPQGAIAGALTSLAVVSWLSVGSQVMVMQGRIHYPHLPSNVSGCDPPVTPTEQPSTE